MFCEYNLQPGTDLLCPLTLFCHNCIKNSFTAQLIERNYHCWKGGTFIFGGTFLMKPLDVTGGTFILGGTFQKNFCKGHLVRLLETVRLFGSG